MNGLKCYIDLQKIDVGRTRFLNGGIDENRICLLQSVSKANTLNGKLTSQKDLIPLDFIKSYSFSVFETYFAVNRISVINTICKFSEIHWNWLKSDVNLRKINYIWKIVLPVKSIPGWVFLSHCIIRVLIIEQAGVSHCIHCCGCHFPSTSWVTYLILFGTSFVVFIIEGIMYCSVICVQDLLAMSSCIRGRTAIGRWYELWSPA